MGITKFNLFSAVQNDMAASARAFSNPARVAIIQYLLKSKACINCDLVNELGLAQATISQHLRELKELGIIQGTIEGTSISYCINPKRWEEVKNQFSELFNGFNISNQDKNC